MQVHQGSKPGTIHAAPTYAAGIHPLSVLKQEIFRQGRSDVDRPFQFCEMIACSWRQGGWNVEERGSLLRLWRCDGTAGCEQVVERIDLSSIGQREIGRVATDASCDSGDGESRVERTGVGRDRMEEGIVSAFG